MEIDIIVSLMTLAGTILTVIRQTSEAFSEYAQKEISLLKAMHFIVDEAK